LGSQKAAERIPTTGKNVRQYRNLVNRVGGISRLGIGGIRNAETNKKTYARLFAPWPAIGGIWLQY
jgi:hypothetical protein